MRILAVIICLLVPALGHAEESNPVGKVWNKHCKKCHGADGDATKIGLKMKSPENLYEASMGKTVEEIIQSIHDGKNKMPSFKKKLTEQEIHDLAAYINYSSLVNKVMESKGRLQEELDSIQRDYKNLPECPAK
jgi:cytochrome c6